MLAFVQVILTIAYPLAIVWALSRFEARLVAGAVLGLLVLRGVAWALLRRRDGRRRDILGRDGGPGRVTGGVPWSLAVPVVAVAAVSAGTAIANDPLGLLLAPVFVNAALLASFAASLRREPIVETLARLQVERLAPAEVRYCRRVTELWCAFFVLNGAVSFVLAWTRSLDAWALYTGFLSYCLMGLLFAGEYVYRHARFRRYVGGPADRVLAHFFPSGHLPERVGLDAAADSGVRTVLLEVPTGLDCWPGHFPERPMLPGVLQVDWVLREVELWRGERPRLRALEGLKFRQPVRPGDAVSLELERVGASESGETVDFRFLRGGEEVSRGRLRLAVPGRLGVVPSGASSRPGSTAQGGDSGETVNTAWPSPAAILVHADPMIWLRSVEAHDACETRCLVSVADLAAYADPDGGVGAHVALEWMAQAVAAHAGLERRARGEEPLIGLLLGSKRVEFARSAYTGRERFRVVAVRGWGGEQGAASFDCRVESLDGAERVADARLSCFMPGDAAEVDAASSRGSGGASGRASGAAGPDGGAGETGLGRGERSDELRSESTRPGVR